MVRLLYLTILVGAYTSVDAFEDQGLYLYHIPVRTSDVDTTEQSNLRLFLDGADQVANGLRLSGLPIIDIDSDSFSLLPKNFPTLTGAATDDELADSFIIDFGEPSVQQMLAAQTWHASGELPSLTALSTSVYDWINDKTMARGFDYASTTAKTRSGDCTEHALLLAAVARATGRPARVVLGVLIVDENEPQAYGHAWTQVWQEGGWQLLDATEPQRNVDSANLYYIPLGLIEDESPAFAINMVRITMRFPSRIEWARVANLTD